MAKSKSFRILKEDIDFEFEIKDIGLFTGRQDDLLKDIKNSKLTMLTTKAWRENGAYSINYKSIASNFRNGSPLSTILNKYRVEERGAKSFTTNETKGLDSFITLGVEGSPQTKLVTTYERDPKLRLAAIELHGYICKACGFDFQKVYGELGKGYIHIHHVVPVSKGKKSKEVNPKTDLVPLCANCHSMVHKSNKETLKVSELKSIIESNKATK